MPLQSEIIQRLTGDNSNLRSVLNQTEKLADSTGKSILKKLDLKDGSRAIATAIGLNIQSIAEGFARSITGLSKEAEDAIQSLEQASDRSAAAAQKSLDMRRTTLQQIAALQRDVARSQNAMNDAINAKPQKEVGSFLGIGIGRGSAIDVALGLSRRKDAERAVKLAQAEADIKEKSLEIDVKTKAVEDDHMEQIVRNENMRADYVRQNREQVELEAKALSGRILPSEQLRLQLMKLQQKVRENSEQTENILAKFPEERSQKEKEHLITLQNQKKVLDKQIEAKETLIAKTGAQVKVEEAVADTMHFATASLSSFVDEWENFQSSVTGRGRGDTELSDRELERKIANIQSELATSAGRGLGSFQGSAGTGSSDFLTQQQRGAANQAQTELDFRRQVRNAASTFGEGAAFNQFNGLTEQRFREILQSQPGTQDVVAELKKLNGALKQGIPTVFFGNDNAA